MTLQDRRLEDIATEIISNGEVFAQVSYTFCMFGQNSDLYSLWLSYHGWLQLIEKGFLKWELKCLLCDNDAISTNSLKLKTILNSIQHW